MTRSLRWLALVCSMEFFAITKNNLGFTFDHQQLFDFLFYRQVKTLRHPIFMSDGLFKMSNRLRLSNYICYLKNKKLEVQ